MIIPKTLLFLSAFIICGAGVILGKYSLISVDQIDSLEKLLASVEKINSLSILANPSSKRNDQTKPQENDLKRLSDSERLHSHLNRLEQEIIELSNLREDYPYPDVSETNDRENKHEIIKKEAFHKSIELLDQASVDGKLDDSAQLKLDGMLKSMDKKAKIIFWERMFLDLGEGKYRLPARGKS